MLAPPPRLRSPRPAVTAIFAFDGLVFGSWAARIPDVTAQIGATHSTLGVALLCLSLGALAAMQLTGTLCARLGPGVVTVLGAVLLCLVVPLPGLASSVPQLCAALLAFGAVTGLLGVAVNSAGVAVQDGHPTPLLPGMHAAFSLGGLGGAAAGGLASGLGPVATHLVGVAALGTVVVAWAAPPLLRLRRLRPADVGSGPRPRRPVVLLGVIAGCTAFGEGALTDWGALHLQETLGASPVAAAAGYAGFSLAMAVGRLAGGTLLRRLGETRLLAGGALLAAAAMTVALTTTSVPVAVVGFTLVGLGCANLFPVTIARAGAIGGAGGVALASTVGYSGLLGGPPVIGFVAERSGLPAALATVPVLAVGAAVLAVAVADRPARARARDRAAALARPVLRAAASALRGHADDLLGLTASVAPRVRPYPGLELLTT